MSKHTKGPWTFSPQDGKPGHCHMAQVWDNTGHNLAEIEPNDNEEEATANARLIAAAPELLRVLEAFVEHAKYHNIPVGSGMWVQMKYLIILLVLVASCNPVREKKLHHVDINIIEDYSGVTGFCVIKYDSENTVIDSVYYHSPHRIDTSVLMAAMSDVPKSTPIKINIQE